MITLNCTNLDDVGGTFNIEEERKQSIMEVIDSIYLDDNDKIKVILTEILDEIIERDLYPSQVSILMHDNDLFESISTFLYNWDIDVLKL